MKRWCHFLDIRLFKVGLPFSQSQIELPGLNLSTINHK
ncbi:hypothetical protein ADICYQ_3140 [Cyclobacterium qasimii M12-11B]|uniref:Uncharacterized protein n=1 Tax=Cyclobacterium qasimii M12-11B TaxID=641524 RepID=S7VE79_9BACT|nr:hypothetical protein ADICYQ_3140 [Cyclobacterium qasimii M12-11B]